jgi:hypothetical protein
MRRLRDLPRSIGWPVALLIVLAVSAAGATAAQKLTGRDVANSSLTGVDVRNSSLSGADIRNRSLTPRDFRESVRGPQGPQGPPGTFSQQLTVVRSDPRVVAPGGVEVARALCPPNAVAVSGGHTSLPVEPTVPAVLTIATNSFQSVDLATGREYWLIQVVNVDSTNAASISAVVQCASSEATAAAAVRDRRLRLLSEQWRALSQRDRSGVSGRIQPGQLP